MTTTLPLARAAGHALLVAATLAACDRRGPGVARPCDPIAAVDTTGWTRRAASDSLHTFLMPATFARTDPTPIPGARARWVASARAGQEEGRAIEEIVSEWTTEALRPRRGERGLAYMQCTARIDGRRVYIASRHDGTEYTITAWFIPEAKPDSGAGSAAGDSAAGDSAAADSAASAVPSLLLDARGRERADQDLFLAIVRSAKRTP